MNRLKELWLDFYNSKYNPVLFVWWGVPVKWVNLPIKDINLYCMAREYCPSSDKWGFVNYHFETEHYCSRDFKVFVPYWRTWIFWAEEN